MIAISIIVYIFIVCPQKSIHFSAAFAVRCHGLGRETGCVTSVVKFQSIQCAFDKVGGHSFNCYRFVEPVDKEMLRTNT